jgi:NADP-dependent 3-hydroxy acid dehydrogenase YdfG
MDLSGKVGVVTGVSKGIGLETVKALLDEDMIVAGWGRTEPEFRHKNFHFYKTDVSNFEAVQSSFQSTSANLGQVAVLINNAGLGFAGMLHEMPNDDWQTMFNTNVNGVFYCAKMAIPGMIELEEGHIINIASIAGITGIEKMAGYCGSKFAVRGISHSLFKEVRNFGIKVTCIYPGSTNTNFFDEFEGVNANENMMRPEDVASSIIHVLNTHPNYHVVDVEMRPLMPKGKPNK